MKPMTQAFRTIITIPAALMICGLVLGLWFSPGKWSLRDILAVLVIPGYCLVGWVTMQRTRLPAFQWLGFALHFLIVSAATYFAFGEMLSTKLQGVALAAALGAVFSLFWFLASREQRAVD